MTGYNLNLVMRRHLKLKKAMAEFKAVERSFTSTEVNDIIKLDKDIEETEEMLMVFIPKNFLKNQLNQLTK